MQRKIIAQGLGGRTIFLPIGWVRENHLDTGDEITVHEKGSNLVLSAHKPTQQKIVIDVTSDHDRSIRIQLQNVYRLGYENIEVRVSNSKQHKIIQDLVEKYFIGCEITEEKNNMILIRTIAESNLTSQDTMVQRMFYIIAETFLEVKKLFETNSKNKELIIEYSDKITKYDNFLRRIISTKKLFDDKTYLYWSLSAYLNLIQRNLLHQVEQFPLSNKATPALVRLLVTLESTFLDMKKSFLAKDGKGMDRISEKINKGLTKDFLPTLTVCASYERIGVYYCAELARLLYLLSSPLYGILDIDTELKK